MYVCASLLAWTGLGLQGRSWACRMVVTRASLTFHFPLIGLLRVKSNFAWQDALQGDKLESCPANESPESGGSASMPRLSKDPVPAGVVTQRRRRNTGFFIRNLR